MIDGARIASLLRNKGWLLNLFFIFIGTHFVASAASAIVARAVRVVPSVDDLPLHAAIHPVSAALHPAFVAMNARNLLGLKHEELNPSLDNAASDGTQKVMGRDFKEDQLKPCSMPAILRATLVVDDIPEWSTAIIMNNSTRETAVYSINDGFNQITDDAFLVAIRSREVVVRRTDHFELCTCDGEAAVALHAMPPAADNIAFGDEMPAAPSPNDTSGVSKISETSYRVERAEVDRALTNLNEVATQARIVPSFKNGKPNGFKIFSIKPGSIYSKIGLTNGDVIQKINGYEMNSPDRALELYTKLREVSSLTIEIQRRGQVMTMNYTIN